jgi:hypothetical protein
LINLLCVLDDAKAAEALAEETSKSASGGFEAIEREQDVKGNL